MRYIKKNRKYLNKAHRMVKTITNSIALLVYQNYRNNKHHFMNNEHLYSKPERFRIRTFAKAIKMKHNDSSKAHQRMQFRFLRHSEHPVESTNQSSDTEV